MEVIECGQKITTVHGITGVITIIQIAFTNVLYELTYMVDGKKETIWIHEKEIEGLPTKNKIGFVQ